MNVQHDGVNVLGNGEAKQGKVKFMCKILKYNTSFNSTEDKASTRQSSTSLSIHGRDVEDLDSGLGSSQSSSPATSSVSSVDTNGDDLIDFSTRTQNYSKGKRHWNLL